MIELYKYICDRSVENFYSLYKLNSKKKVKLRNSKTFTVYKLLLHENIQKCSFNVVVVA